MTSIKKKKKRPQGFTNTTNRHHKMTRTPQRPQGFTASIRSLLSGRKDLLSSVSLIIVSASWRGPFATTGGSCWLRKWSIFVKKNMCFSSCSFPKVLVFSLNAFRSSTGTFSGWVASLLWRSLGGVLGVHHFFARVPLYGFVV